MGPGTDINGGLPQEILFSTGLNHCGADYNDTGILGRGFLLQLHEGAQRNAITD